MKSNKFLIFLIVTIAVIVAAGIMSRHRAPATSMEKQLLFPTFVERVNDVSTIEIKEHERTLSLVETDKQWGIKQADNYPADFGKIRETVIAVSELMILAEKTSNPELYERLGVGDPAEEGANSLLLSLLDKEGNNMVSLIVGNSRHSKSAEGQDGLYVRLPGAASALLVEGQLDISAESKDWFMRELFDIDAARIKHIQITQADKSRLVLAREKNVDEFVIEDIPEGREAQSQVMITRMGTLLEDIAADKVISAKRLADLDKTTTTVRTFDGLIAEITNARLDDVNYSSFAFSAAEDTKPVPAEADAEKEKGTGSEQADPAAEAATLNEQLSGWAYAIPDFKFELFTRTMEQITREIVKEKPAAEADTSATSE